MPPTPTPVPDPCSPENIVSETEELQAVGNSFQDAMNIANNTDVSLLIHRSYDCRNSKGDPCDRGAGMFANPQGKSIDYTFQWLNYLLIFMNTQDPAFGGSQCRHSGQPSLMAVSFWRNSIRF